MTTDSVIGIKAALIWNPLARRGETERANLDSGEQGLCTDDLWAGCPETGHEQRQ